jgi:collagenase-like PrtC family protease
MNKKIYWHLPGFCFFRSLNLITIDLLKEFPEKFRDNYQVGSVYGTFPGAIWNDGRAVFGLIPKHEIENTLKLYNSEGIPVRFTWTNSLLEEKHLYDTYCNLIMHLADNGFNQVLVNSQILEDYIRHEYPSFPLISSTTKRITDRNKLRAELFKDYYLVVLDYDLNHDQILLDELKPFADRLEILVNEVCYPNCQKRSEHYAHQSRMQLEYNVHTSFPCPNNSTPRAFSECMNRPAFISNERIGNYIDRGYVNFKIAGRGMPVDYVKNSYLYFLVRDEHREFIRKKIDTILQQVQQAKRAKK